MDSAATQSLRSKLALVARHIPGGALLFAVLMLVVLGYFGWYYYGAEHLDQALYSLRLENMTVTPKPDWIKGRIDQEVYEKHRLDRISLLDPRANATIAQAFETHHWVKTTSRVSKSAGGKVVVDLVYRRPAAMIYVQRVDPVTGQAKDGFFPIDNEGTMLPSADFTEKDVRRYFIIFAQDAHPAGDVGMPYGDVRVSAALSLCEFLEPYREQFGLEVIEVQQDSLAGGSSPWTLIAFTRDKRREIVWGHAPSAEASGELPAEEKLKRLVAWLQQPLPTDSQAVQAIDLRYAASVTPIASRRSHGPLNY